MNQNKTISEQQQQQLHELQESQSVVRQQTVCSRCGAHHDVDQLYCSECGVRLDTNRCAQCGADIEADMELCPHCGRNLKVDMCSFCGGMLDPDDQFCAECGNPRAGIDCPQCHTLNFRSFCRVCNSPLNEMAQLAMQEAQQDPKVMRVIELAQELAKLEAFLLDDTPAKAAPPQAPELSDEDKQLIEQYKNVIEAFKHGALQPPKSTEDDLMPKDIPPTKPTAPRNDFDIAVPTKEEAMKQYRANIGEMKALMDAMIPDANMTPQMQRNYHSARKMTVEKRTKIKEKLYWVCNAYGCKHNQPNECSKPYQGGKWYYAEKIVITTEHI